MTGVTYSADGSQLFSVGDRTIRIWDTSTGKELHRISTGDQPVDSIAISPDARTIATGGDSTVLVWSVDEPKPIATLSVHTASITEIQFSPTGRHLVTASFDSNLAIWDTQTWQLASLTKSTTHPRDIAFTPDGDLVTLGSQRPSAQQRQIPNATLFEIPSGKIKSVFSVDSWAAVSSVAVSRDGRLLATAHGGDQAHDAVTIWNLATKSQLARVDVGSHGEQWIDAMEFSLDGETLFLGSNDNVVTSLQWSTGQSTVLFPNGRVLPWKLILLGGTAWLFAWRFAPRLPRHATRPSPATSGRSNSARHWTSTV